MLLLLNFGTFESVTFCGENAILFFSIGLIEILCDHLEFIDIWGSLDLDDIIFCLGTLGATKEELLELLSFFSSFRSVKFR